MCFNQTISTKSLDSFHLCFKVDFKCAKVLYMNLTTLFECFSFFRFNDWILLKIQYFNLILKDLIFVFLTYFKIKVKKFYFNLNIKSIACGFFFVFFLMTMSVGIRGKKAGLRHHIWKSQTFWAKKCRRIRALTI